MQYTLSFSSEHMLMKPAQYNNNNSNILPMHSVVVFGILYGPSTIVSKIHVSATICFLLLYFTRDRGGKSIGS